MSAAVEVLAVGVVAVGGLAAIVAVGQEVSVCLITRNNKNTRTREQENKKKDGMEAGFSGAV